jgi:hypothetical protein
MTRRSRTIAALIALGVLVVVSYLALNSEVGRAQTGRPSRAAETYSKDGGYFYRFRAAFEVKDTGERLDFDYVVACNIRLTRWRDGGLSNDSTFSPRIMVKATAGGQAVMLRTHNACSGLTSENEDIPPDLLPLAVWFDDVGNLSNGLGYISEDAYDNPLGKLKFHGARVDRATRSEWEAWRKKAADEYAQRGVLPGPWGYDYGNHPEPNNTYRGGYVSSCDGFRRLRIPESLRAGIRELWPPERPRYWTLRNKNEFEIEKALSDSKQPSPPGIGPWIRRFGTPTDSKSWGLPLRSGRHVGKAPHVKTWWAAEIYPFLWPPIVSVLPMRLVESGAGIGTYVQKLEFREGALNGFAACQNTRDIAGTAMREADPAWKTKRHVFMVDDVVLRELSDETLFGLKPAFVVERDESVFIQFSTFLN